MALYLARARWPSPARLSSLRCYSTAKGDTDITYFSSRSRSQLNVVTTPKGMGYVPRRKSKEYFRDISPKLRRHAIDISKAVEDARGAAEIAAREDSTDSERDGAVNRARYALRLYKSFLEHVGEEQAKVKLLLDKDVESLKEEIYKARKQRVWIGWTGWF